MPKKVNICQETLWGNRLYGGCNLEVPGKIRSRERRGRGAGKVESGGRHLSPGVGSFVNIRRCKDFGQSKVALTSMDHHCRNHHHLIVGDFAGSLITSRSPQPLLLENLGASVVTLRNRLTIIIILIKESKTIICSSTTRQTLQCCPTLSLLNTKPNNK